MKRKAGNHHNWEAGTDECLAFCWKKKKRSYFSINCFSSFKHNVMMHVQYLDPDTNTNTSPPVFLGHNLTGGTCFNPFLLFYLVHVRKDDVWDNLILTAEDVLCLCPRRWTDLDVWDGRRCNDTEISIESTPWKAPWSTTAVCMHSLKHCTGLSLEGWRHVRSQKTFHL